MQLKARYLCGVIVVLIYVFIRTFYVEKHEYEDRPLSNNKFLPTRSKNMSLYHIANIKKNVTIILRHLGSTTHYLVLTVNSFLAKYPNIPIVVVSDSMIVFSLMSNITNLVTVKVIPLKLDLINLVVDRNPLNYVKTRYLLIVPIGISAVPPLDIITLTENYIENNCCMLILPVDNNAHCLQMDLNLRIWTLEYKNNKYSEECDFVYGDHGLFAETKKLKKIGEPFMLPFPESLYIQAKALDLRFKMSNVILKKSALESDSQLKYTQHHRILMYMQLGIKKVIKETGLTEWYGCTRNTSRCFGTVVNSMPHYILQGKWTPPCCLKVLRETAHHVFKTLSKWNVRYWLEGGTLLGAMRSKDIIPWDYDVDIGIYQEDIPKCPWLKKAQMQSNKIKPQPMLIDNEGFVWEAAKADEGKFFRVQSSISNTLHVDIFPFYSKSGIMTKDTWFLSHPQDKEFPEHFLKPLTTIEFVGFNASAPNNIREFLEFKFGKGCVENPEYPNPKLLPFPFQEKPEQDGNLNY